eukprot:Platyproteum_vivax@DN5312_c0_g1_i2.p1
MSHGAEEPEGLDYLPIEKSTYPDLGEKLDAIKEQLQKKCYHQLTDLLFDYIADPRFDDNRILTKFHKQFVEPTCVKKINPLRYLLIFERCYQKADPAHARAELAINAEWVHTHRDAQLYYQCLMAQKYLTEDNLEDSLKVLEETESLLESHLGVDTLVKSAYHRAMAEICKKKGQTFKFYTHLVSYMNYTPLDKIRPSERGPLAFEIAVAAMVCPTTFNFGELLQNPLFSVCLKESEFAWIYDFLEALNEGQFQLMDAARKKHAKKFEAVPELVAADKTSLRDKITLLVLMEVAFEKPKKLRRMDLQEIAEACRVPVNEVEMLVMRAMNANLVRGSIDEVEGVVRFTWVKPRILDMTRLKIMQTRIDAWGKQASTMMSTMEDLAPELLMGL